MNKFDELFAQRGLSLERLWVFEKIGSTQGSLIRAADGDDGRAAQFAKQKSELEEYFAAKLTKRRPQSRKLELTAEGEELARITREFFSKLLDFRAQCTDRPKRFSIGAGDSLLHWLVIPCLADLQKSHKQYSFSLHNLQNADIINGLLDFSLDFGLVRKDHAVQPLTRVVLGAKTYALYVPKALLGNVDPKTLKEKQLLQKLPLAAQSKRTHFQREFERAAAAAKIRLTVSLYCESVPEVVHALKTERYAAVLHSFASKELDSTRFEAIPLRFLRKVAPEIALVWNPSLLNIRGETATKLKEVLSKALRFGGGGPALSTAQAWPQSTLPAAATVP